MRKDSTNKNDQSCVHFLVGPQPKLLQPCKVHELVQLLLISFAGLLAHLSMLQNAGSLHLERDVLVEIIPEAAGRPALPVHLAAHGTLHPL
jgi:hypothetical protein